MNHAQAIGCVLAGGRSSRMGQDKATLLHGPHPFVWHMVAKLRGAGCDAVISGSRPDLAQYAPILPDLHPGCGPLSGIEAALRHSAGLPHSSPDEPVLFVPVDLPLLPVSVLTLLLARASRTGALATVPLAGGRPQPLCAVYRCSLLPGISRALVHGHYKVMRVLDSLSDARSLDLFNVEAVISASPLPDELVAPHRWFANINTPADAAHLTRTRVS